MLQPKFIHAILKRAEERKRENDIIFERKVAREQAKEDHLFEDKEKFITSAYKDKLKENKIWEMQVCPRVFRMPSFCHRSQSAICSRTVRADESELQARLC